MISYRLKVLLLRLRHNSPLLIDLSLSFDDGYLFDDDCLRAIASASLQSIDISRNVNVTRNSVITFLTACPYLREVKLPPQFDTDEMIRHTADVCPHLIVLDVRGYNVSIDAARYAIRKLPYLQKIKLKLRNHEDFVHLFQDMEKYLSGLSDLAITTSYEQRENVETYLEVFFKKFSSLKSLVIESFNGEEQYQFLVMNVSLIRCS